MPHLGLMSIVQYGNLQYLSNAILAVKELFIYLFILGGGHSQKCAMQSFHQLSEGLSKNCMSQTIVVAICK